MSIVLAATWDPRGEFNRLKRLMPLLRELYSAFVVVLPAHAREVTADDLYALGVARVLTAEPWLTGRFHALEAAVETQALHVHYADLDRLIRWAETRPDELRKTLALLETVDALIIGRTEQALATHPAALRQTERTINRLFAHLLGQPLDLPAGSKGFSRRAARCLLTHTDPDHGLGTDSTWPVLLQRCGFTLTPVAVDGLDWETPDRYREVAADAALQAQTATIYDAAPDHWRYRVDLAHDIIAAGLQAWVQPLEQDIEEPTHD